MSYLQLDTVKEKISEKLANIESAKDKSYILHREIIKKSGLAIRAVHRGEEDNARQLVESAGELLNKATAVLKDYPEMSRIGFMHDAQKELAEAAITVEIVFKNSLPDPDAIGVTYPAYLNGMGEVIGELRREILDLMRQDQGEKGERFLEIMDEIYYLLVQMDFSDSVTFGLRRTTDVARSILEKTRGDFTNYTVSKKFRDSLPTSQVSPCGK